MLTQAFSLIASCGVRAPFFPPLYRTRPGIDPINILDCSYENVIKTQSHFSKVPVESHVPFMHTYIIIDDDSAPLFDL